MPRAAVVAMHARSGMVALNIVTAALGDDADVRFVRDVDAMAAELRAVVASGKRAIGAWSFYSPDFAKTVRDLERLKANTPDIDVLHVAGGVHATAEPLATLRAGFDLVAIGEGELTVREIVRAVESDADPRTLRGTAHLDERKALVSHGPGDRADPLDGFPAFNAKHKKWNALEITRGCVYACSFCQTPFMFKARFRHRSVANVRTHVDHMTREGSKFVRFLTPTSLSYGSEDTSVNVDAVDELLASVREGVGKDGKVFFGTFPSEIRPEHVSERSLAVLRKWVDNATLVIGGQSGSDRVLERSRRGHTVDDVVRAVELAVAAGFQPDVDFLLGLPGETPDDRLASMKLAEKIVALGARIHSHAFMPLPGTPLRDAVPEPIEEQTMLAMSRLESSGRAYGQWRRQMITAAELVRARRA